MIAKKDIPNYLTYARMAAVPLLLLVWYLPAPLGSYGPLLLVALASLTDFFDGWLARRWQVQSAIGRLLDPNADKLLIAVALLLLASGGLASVVAVALILCRELFVSGLREFLAERNIVLHVTRLAKWKTAAQMVAVLTLLLAHALGSADVSLLGSLLLWIATTLTLVTGWDYWRSAKPYLFEDNGSA